MRSPVPSLAAAALVLGALSVGGASAGAAPAPDGESSAPSLPRSANGQQAIGLLGDQLDEAAALNGWTPAQLRDVLATDSTAWVGRDGRVFYKDLPAPAESTGPEDGAGTDVPPFPLLETFQLHSKPGSNLTLLLDFDGTNVSNTQWNSTENVPAGDYPAWTVDGDATTFNDAEREAIQTIWQRVAEDYAPFDIDVTTQDPGLAGIERASNADTVYGTRALVTPSNTAQTAICGGPVCGGVAYINVFGEVGSSHQPAWIFPQSLGPNSPKSIAEAISHEVGHNFSLQHDGVTSTSFQSVANCSSTTGYYCGHAMWAPIMGVGYYKPVVQWSKGEYAGANNTGQNDVALIAQRAPYRTDEAGGTLATASTTTPGTKYIAQATDQDVYLLGTCTGALTVSAATPTPATPSPDLDIKLELLDSSGTVVASSDPPSAFVTTETASGLTASVTQAVAGGSYFVRVDGVGIGTPQSGYSDYASVGAYALTVSGGVCTAPTGLPAAPLNVVATGDAPTGSAAVSWAAPANVGGGAVTGYQVYLNGALHSTTTTPSATLTGLAVGTAYDVAVSAVNVVGTGAQAHAAPFTLGDKPSAPAIGKAKAGRKGGKKTASVAWSAPTSTGGLPITGYRVVVVKAKNGKVVRTVDVAPGARSYVAKKLKSGKYRFAVTALNALGAGPQSGLSRAVRAR